MKIQFRGDDIFLRTFKSNKDNFRVEIETGRDQWEVLKDLPMLPNGSYNITIEPEIIEE